VVRHSFATAEVRDALQPVIGLERFNAGPASAVDFDPVP
jgi:hypothetical protein